MDKAEGPKLRYLTKWEKNWPWLSKAPGDKEQAYCTLCDCVLGLYASRFPAHAATNKHRRNEKLMTYGDVQELERKKKRRLEEDFSETRGRKRRSSFAGSPEPTIFDLPDDDDEDYEGDLSTHKLDSSTGDPATTLAHLDGQLLHGIEVKVLHEAENSLQFSNFKMELPVITMCSLKANAQHPTWLQEQLEYALSTGTGYDAVWICDGGLYRVHKAVLAAFSQELKAIMPDSETDAVINTPDLSSELVKSMLCLIYTGKTLITWKNLNDINVALKMIGLCGQDLTAVPNNITNIKSLAISYAASQDKLSKKEFTPIKLMSLASALGTNCKLTRDQWATLNSLVKKRDVERKSALLTPGELENPGRLFDVMDTWNSGTTPKMEPAENIVKIEVEDDLSGDEENIEPKISIENLPPEIAGVDSIKKEPVKRFMCGKQIMKDLDILSNSAMLTSDNEIVRLNNKNFASVGWHGRDLKETRVGYPVYNKGERSRQLPFDLFDDRNMAESVKIIIVCPICFKLFDDKEKMKDHRELKHNYSDKERPRWNSMVVGKNKFVCNKCRDTLELKHLVWFVKHYKYCGIDDLKANDLMHVDEIEELLPREKISRVEKSKVSSRAKRAREEDVLEVTNVTRNKFISRFLFGKEVAEIWGCRKCYKAFEDETTYRKHINTEHEGKIEHGTCYDHESKQYFCPKCKVYKTDKNVHYLIYHMAQCYVYQQGSAPMDDEEGIDDDTNDEYVDPWGIVNKPLQVRSFRSKWICEAFFGQLYNILFPCHLCYNVFKSEEEVREHFRTTHPGLQNFLEDGDHYDREKKMYKCPYCKRDVCKNQRNSIFFTYHMRKCNKELFEVTRACPKCQKNFSVFNSLQYHIQTMCDTASSICHICGLKVKDANGLKKHVMITHSDARPYPCKVCNKAFKRAADLEFHTKLHLGSLDWSCEKCGKSFPVKKALKTHMKTHASERDKPYACHICGNRFMRKCFLENHLTTHSSFRGFVCEICNSSVKTKDTLKHHRRKVHNLYTPIPDECILKPDSNQVGLRPNLMKGAGKKKRRHQPGQFADLLSGAKIKEEVLPVLDEELQLA